MTFWLSFCIAKVMRAGFPSIWSSIRKGFLFSRHALKQLLPHFSFFEKNAEEAGPLGQKNAEEDYRQGFC
jgi:hypothetical protein